MERGWIETVQMLGLDMMVAVILGVLVTAAIWQLVIALWNALARMARRNRRVLPTSPRDAYATQEWGPAP